MNRISLRKIDQVSLETSGFYKMSEQTWGLLSNLIMVLGHCPELTKTLVPFANSFIFYPIKGNNIDRKLRELVINTVSRFNESHYSITHHTLIALLSGVEQNKLLNLNKWKNSDVYTERELIAIEYAELGSGDSNDVPDEFFKKLHDEFSDSEIVELTVLIGHFNLLNRWFNVLEIEDEPEFLKLYEEHVPPELRTSISYYKPQKRVDPNVHPLTRPPFINKNARVPPVEPDVLLEKEDYETLASAYELARVSWHAGDAGAPNLIKTWAQCPEIAKTEVVFVNSFAFNKDSTIPRGLKELTINTVGRINQCYYSTSAHEWYAQEFGGITLEQLNELKDWKTSSRFTDDEKLVIEYAVEVTLNSNFVSDELFNKIKKRFNEQEIVELTFLISHYQHVTRFLNLLQIELESGRKPSS